MTRETAVLPATRPGWGELGPAMRALANDQQRDFVYLYVQERPRKGALVEAYRAAGYGEGSTPANQAKGAWRLSHDERVIAAIAEETRKIVRVAFPEAANAMLNLVRDPTHRDHGRATMAVMERAFPVETKHNIEVVHKTVDPDVEAIEELRALRKLGISREKLIEFFGGNGLDRIEALEAADANQRAQAAKIIEADVIEAEVLPDQLPVASSGEPAFDPEEDF
jgi:phage terminase small subunit